MSDNGFDFIAQAVLKQKQMMDALANENRELRRQIADLRAGHGIFIEMAGQRFPLKGEITVSQAVSSTKVMQQDFLPSSTTSSLPKVVVSQVSENKESAEAALTLELSPVADALVEKKEEKPEKAPTFLEEIMLDEFVAASTSPMAVWDGPVKKPEQEQIGEEQKAALRRELMGSFLLE